jgi:hypothetical protein
VKLFEIFEKFVQIFQKQKTVNPLNLSCIFRPNGKGNFLICVPLFFQIGGKRTPPCVGTNFLKLKISSKGCTSTLQTPEFAVVALLSG